MINYVDLLEKAKSDETLKAFDKQVNALKKKTFGELPMNENTDFRDLFEDVEWYVEKAYKVKLSDFEQYADGFLSDLFS